MTFVFELSLEFVLAVDVVDGVITEVTLTEQSSPVNPLLHEQTPLASQVP